MENVDDERRQLLEEAMELDHIWGAWEGEEEPTKGHHEWIRQPSQSGNDMRHHIKVHASHREQVWESSLLRDWQSSVPTGSRHVAHPTNACVGEHRAR
jgi:hypothetical protein